jgi:tetratricopeptide (TPR) repeat protein
MKLLLIATLLFFFGRTFAQNEGYYQVMFDSLVAANEQQKGIVFFEAELKKYPGNELVLRSLGALNLQLMKFKETRFYYEKALLINPECAKCYFYIAQALANENNLDGAFQSIEKGLSINSKEGVLYLLRGKLKLYKGDEIGGLNDMTKAILIDPKEAGFYLERADYFIQKQNYFSAKRDLLKAQELSSKNILVYNYLAQVYTYETDFPNALTAINKALEIIPTDLQSLLTRGEVYRTMKEYDRAITDYKQVIVLDPQNYHGYFYLADIYYSLEKMDEYCTALSESIRLMQEQKIGDPAFLDQALSMRKDLCDSSLASYYYQRGIAAFNLKDYQQSISWYNQAVHKFPDEYVYYSFKANTELQQREYRKALVSSKIYLDHMEQVRKEVLQSSKYANISKDSMELYFKGLETSIHIVRTFCYFNLGNTDSALICINAAIDATPEFGDFLAGDSYMMKGILLLDKNLFYEAEMAFKEIAKRSSDWSLCEDYIALSLICQANSKSSLSRNKIEMNSLQNIADIQWIIPDKLLKGTEYADRALNHLQKALKLNSNDPFAYYLRGHIYRQQRMDYCTDFLKANQLGYPVELTYLKECR